MIRRALLGLLPALLALAFLTGTPSTSMGGPEASATSSSAEAPIAPAVPAARGSLNQDVPDGALNARADEDDTSDDRIIRVVSAIVWPSSARETRTLTASERAGPSHHPRAAPSRAPPTA
jgi:hypothetical protein